MRAAARQVKQNVKSLNAPVCQHLRRGEFYRATHGVAASF